MRKTLLITLLAIAPGIMVSQGYNIDVTLKGLADSAIYLAYHFGDKQYIKDTVNVDRYGHAVFSGREPLPHGIYMVVMPGRKYFEVLVSDDQVMSAECLYADYGRTLAFSGSEENSAFLDYQRKWVSMQQFAAALGKRIQNNQGRKDSLAILTTMQKEEEEKRKAYLRSVIAANRNNLLATLVRSLLPIEMPEFNVPSMAKNADSIRWVMQYNYNKDHFFDNIDFRDERLLRTPILHARLKSFFTGVVIQSPDSINREIDKLIAKVKDNYKMFQFVSVFLFNHFRESEIMGHDAVVVKLADDIYLSGKADWVSKDFKDDLRKQVDLIRPNLIGKSAPNLIMDSYKGIYVALDDIEKDYTVVYFWEPDCGHCKEATPRLKTYYEKKHDYSLEIFAVCTTADKDKWRKYIEDNNLSWINGWDPQRTSRFDYFYNVQATPLVYVLDRNKKIIAKKISVEEIGNFIENYRKYYGAK